MFWFQDHEHATFDDILGELKLSKHDHEEWAVCRMETPLGGGRGGRGGGGGGHVILTFLFGHTEEIEKKLTAYRRGSKFWRMLIFCQVRKEGEEPRATPT